MRHSITVLILNITRAPSLDTCNTSPSSTSLPHMSTARAALRVSTGLRVHRRRVMSTQTRASAYVPQGPIEGASVVITGANRGIGLEMAKQLIAKGNHVDAACRSASDELRALEASSEGRLTISTLDVSDPASIDAWASGLKARGVTRVDVCVNNAGVIGSNGYAWDLESTTQEEMIYVFKVNTCGPLLVTKALLREGLLGEGSLVGNVTSKAGSIDDNGSGGGYSYRASKTALNQVNKSLSIDLRDRGVHFALLHPGYVRTGMTDGKGIIDAPESAAGLIALLEGAHGDCETNWFDYKGDAIKW